MRARTSSTILRYRFPRLRALSRNPTCCLQQRFPGVRMVVFGHLGDGNLHYNVSPPAGTDAARFLEQQRRFTPRCTTRRMPSRIDLRPSTASAS